MDLQADATKYNFFAFSNYILRSSFVSGGRDPGDNFFPGEIIRGGGLALERVGQQSYKDNEEIPFYRSKDSYSVLRLFTGFDTAVFID